MSVTGPEWNSRTYDSAMVFLSDILAKLTQDGINAIFKIQKGTTRTATASPKLYDY